MKPILKAFGRGALAIALLTACSFVVEQGDLLGLCGNSGNSSEPHIHFHGWTAQIG